MPSATFRQTLHLEDDGGQLNVNAIIQIAKESVVLSQLHY